MAMSQRPAGGHAIAGAIGGALLWAVTASLVGQVYLLGLSLVYLRVTEGLDLTASEEALRAKFDERAAALPSLAKGRAKRLNATRRPQLAAWVRHPRARRATPGGAATPAYSAPPAFTAAPAPAFDPTTSDPPPARRRARRRCRRLASARRANRHRPALRRPGGAPTRADRPVGVDPDSHPGPSAAPASSGSAVAAGDDLSAMPVAGRRRRHVLWRLRLSAQVTHHRRAARATRRCDFAAAQAPPLARRAALARAGANAPRPGEQLPRDLAEAYRLQAAVIGELGAVGGWKIAAVTRRAADLLGVPVPIAGHSPTADARCAPRAGELRIADFIAPKLECEFAFELARDLPPRPGRAYSRDEVARQSRRCASASRSSTRAAARPRRARRTRRRVQQRRLRRRPGGSVDWHGIAFAGVEIVLSVAEHGDDATRSRAAAARQSSTAIRSARSSCSPTRHRTPTRGSRGRHRHHRLVHRRAAAARARELPRRVRDLGSVELRFDRLARRRLLAGGLRAHGVARRARLSAGQYCVELVVLRDRRRAGRQRATQGCCEAVKMWMSGGQPAEARRRCRRGRSGSRRPHRGARVADAPRVGERAIRWPAPLADGVSILGRAAQHALSTRGSRRTRRWLLLAAQCRQPRCVAATQARVDAGMASSSGSWSASV